MLIRHYIYYVGILGTSQNTSQAEASGSVSNSFNGQILPTPNIKIFTFKEMKAATKNFKENRLLGEGGKVFKGCLQERAILRIGSETPVVVKRLNSMSYEGFEEWQLS